MRSFYSLPKKTHGGMAVLDATGDDSAIASCVSLNVCPPRLLNLMPWLSLLHKSICF